MKTFCITGKLKDKSGNFLERDEAIYLIEKKEAVYTPQDHNAATYAKKLKKRMR